MEDEIRSLGDAAPHPVQTIAEEDPKAAGLVVELLERSRAETDSIMERIGESKDRDIEIWKERAHRAEARLAKIEDRVLNLLFAEHSPLDTPFFE